MTNTFEEWQRFKKKINLGGWGQSPISSLIIIVTSWSGTWQTQSRSGQESGNRVCSSTGCLFLIMRASIQRCDDIFLDKDWEVLWPNVLKKYALCNIKIETCSLVQAKVVSEIIRKTLGIRREVIPIRPSSDILCFKSILLWGKYN